MQITSIFTLTSILLFSSNSFADTYRCIYEYDSNGKAIMLTSSFENVPAGKRVSKLIALGDARDSVGDTVVYEVKADGSISTNPVTKPNIPGVLMMIDRYAKKEFEASFSLVDDVQAALNDKGYVKEMSVVTSIWGQTIYSKDVVYDPASGDSKRSKQVTCRYTK